jgi:hypothetical protein
MTFNFDRYVLSTCWFYASWFVYIFILPTILYIDFCLIFLLFNHAKLLILTIRWSYLLDEGIFYALAYSMLFVEELPVEFLKDSHGLAWWIVFTNRSNGQ